MAESLMFADDLAILVKGRAQLRVCMKMIQDWAEENKIRINKAKSAIMRLKVDNRTPEPVETDIEGIKFVREYKYLGVTFTNTFKFKADLQIRTDRDKKLQRMKWILMDKKLNGQSRNHIFQALFKSITQYMQNLLSVFSQEERTWMKKFMYRSVKELTGVKGNPKMETLLRTALGQCYEDYLKSEQLKTLHNMYTKAPPDEQNEIRNLTKNKLQVDLKTVKKQQIRKWHE